MRHCAADENRKKVPRFPRLQRWSRTPAAFHRRNEHKLPSIELNKAEFAQALQLKPNSIFVEKMFLLADADRNGSISYPEFIDLMVLLSQGMPICNWGLKIIRLLIFR